MFMLEIEGLEHTCDIRTCKNNITFCNVVIQVIREMLL